MWTSGWLMLAGALLAAPVQAATCRAVSGAHAAALVELYTSQGCSSCPPAERWLGALNGGRRVVALALHVDYWDHLGWKDLYAQRAFAQRQRRLARAAGVTFVYTPQVLLQGRNFRDWATAAFERAVARINATPARATLRLELGPVRGGAAEVLVRAELVGRGRRPGAAALYLATYQSGLSDWIRAGENRGRHLRESYVLREWFGPIGFAGAAQLRVQRRVAVPPGARPGRWGVAAFVQGLRDARVLQALELPACPPP